MVRHRVNDFAAWRAVYDDFDAKRRSMGVRDHAVYCAIDDPLDVTVTHDFDTSEAAQSFAASSELKAAMERAGVAGAPTVWFVTPA